MLNEPPTSFVDKSLQSTIHALAGYIIINLNDVQNSGELTNLLQHTYSEIRQEALKIHDELSQFIVQLGKI